MYETTFLKHSSGSVVRSNSFSTTFASTDDVALLALRRRHWDALRAVASELVDVLGAVAVRHIYERCLIHQSGVSRLLLDGLGGSLATVRGVGAMQKRAKRDNTTSTASRVSPFASTLGKKSEENPYSHRKYHMN